MREIKFRSWNVVDKTMHNSIYNCKDSFEMQLKHPQIYKIMQYTGIKDKNGVEIYEGDIVEVTRKHWNNCNKEYLEKTTKELGVIEFFKNLQMSLKVKDKGYNLYQPLLWILEDDSEIEVIGNIYENSELLEGR